MTDPPPTDLDRHARAIGHMCIWWSRVERFLDFLLACMLDLDPLSDKANSIAANADFREKTRMVRALALITVGTKAQLTNQWRERLDAALIRADDDLRNRRNRFVHDSWHALDAFDQGESPKAVKTHIRTKISKPQSWHPPQLSTSAVETVDVNEIWRLIEEIEETVADLGYCLTRLESPSSAF